jgi:uncharacterized membrane protein YgdD (TMEM256/DUF423 family)
MKDKTILALIALSGFTAVALGAFGAHGLKPYLTEYQRTIFDKGISYQFYHTLAALAAYLFYQTRGTRLFSTASLLFLIGVVFFSGSLYLLAMADLLHFPTAIAGPMTPIGGLFFLAGWATLFVATVKNS